MSAGLGFCFSIKYANYNTPNFKHWLKWQETDHRVRIGREGLINYMDDGNRAIYYKPDKKGGRGRLNW